MIRKGQAVASDAYVSSRAMAVCNSDDREAAGDGNRATQS